MTSKEHLVEQHILEHQSRLKHLDELLERAGTVRQQAAEDLELETALRSLREERDRLAAHVDELRLRSVDDWQTEEIEMAGPMAVWDALAQEAEKLVERFEQHKNASSDSS